MNTKKADTLVYSGNRLASLGQYQEAVLEFRKAVQLYNQLENREGEAVALVNLGSSLVQIGGQSTVEGLETIRNALDIFRELDDEEHVTECLFNLGDAEMKNGLIDDALKSFSECQKMAKQLGNHELLKKVDGILDNARRYGLL